MRGRLHSVLVYFGLIEDPADPAPPTTFAQRFLYFFALLGAVLVASSVIEGEIAEAIILTACVLALVAIGVIRRRRRERR
jgi:hypothetical protein